jgi:large subunit ribosomal protein L4e
MSARQTVRVFKTSSPNEVTGESKLPDVFLVPIRNDIVHFVFYNLNKNRRQPYAVNQHAGMMYNAESWGPGRAVARVPRVSGSGTHRSGQGAFANSCRGGRMFNPTTVWRRWNRKVNLTQKRHAVASALAASAVPSLVLARGHDINQVPEIPLVVDSLQVSATKDLLKIFYSLGLGDELAKVNDSKKIRPGNGKNRNRRYKIKKGPLVIYDNDSINVKKSARNIPSVDVCHVDRLNLLQLAPGGHLGRLIVWTKSAFEKLDKIFGTQTAPGELKKGYVLERPVVSNANISRIINSDDIQSVIRPVKENKVLHDKQKKNPLTNKVKMDYLNPYAKIKKANYKKAQEENIKNKDANRKARLAKKKEHRKKGRQFIIKYHKELEGANEETIKNYKEYILSTKVGKEALKQHEKLEEENKKE